MKTHRYIACDLGAESGRVMLGTLEDDRLTVEEVHRFANDPLQAGDSIRWDLQQIFDELKTGVRKVFAASQGIEGLSCDSWGVDYVLMGTKGEPVSPPFHYRDRRTDDEPARAYAVVPQEKIFDETGIQFMSINTLYQFLAETRRTPGLQAADSFLNIGDYFNFLFSGVAKAEESLASTTQIYNPRTKTWSSHLIERFGFPAGIFPPVVPSGTVLGPVQRSVGRETGAQGVSVIATCSHDTGAAVAAVPAADQQWAYLSSGTWSLLGVELREPNITQKSRTYGFTNEVGFGGTIRFLKNISGLWIIQECRRAWAAEGNDLTYDRLMELAEEAEPMVSFINPLEPAFAKPGDMPAKIAEACQRNGMPTPATVGATIRCVLESLALLYRQTLRQLEDCTGIPIRTLHIVGGGSRSRLLNQLTADVTGVAVLAGPVECTAIGNIMIQAIALGHVPSISAARAIVERSFPTERFEPKDSTAWEKVYSNIQLTTS